MTMSDRIKTRQQPLDPANWLADFETIPRHARADEGARRGDAHGRSVNNVSQDGVEVEGRTDWVRQELEQLREQMAVIKQAVAAEVERKWVSPWRTHQVFDLKVQTRLAGNHKYRSVQNRVRDAAAGLATQSDGATELGRME